jgi:hypothetical protein
LIELPFIVLFLVGVFLFLARVEALLVVPSIALLLVLFSVVHREQPAAGRPNDLIELLGFEAFKTERPHDDA